MTAFRFTQLSAVFVFMEQIEEWKPIPIDGFSEVYSVSNHGRVKSNGFSFKDKSGRNWTKPPRILKPRINQGYHKLSLTLHGKKYYFQAHRMVAEAFIPNPDNKPFINHIDGNGLNNHVSNLEWCTPSENMHHSFYILKKQRYKNKPIKQISKNGGGIVQVWNGINAATKGLGLKHNRGILNVLRGRAKSGHGFKWEYA